MTNAQKTMIMQLKNACRNFDLAINIYSRTELKNAGILRVTETTEANVKRMEHFLNSINK